MNHKYGNLHDTLVHALYEAASNLGIRIAGDVIFNINETLKHILQR